MSPDFFTALIARHAGTTRTVEPRLGSRFEDSRNAGLPEFEREFRPRDHARTVPGVQPPTDVESAAAQHIPARSTGHTPRQGTHQSGTQSATGDSGHKGTYESRAGSARPDAPARPAADHDGSHAAPAWSRRIESILDHLETLRPDPEPTQPQVKRDQAGAHRAPRLHPGQAEQTDQRPGETLDAQLRRPADAATPVRQAPPEPGRPVADHTTPGWIAALQDRLSQRRGLPERSTEPVINVTIGRVDVKAIRDSEPVAPARRKAPAIMSLDDYLARREKGGGS
jgi:hypothetical protein